MIHELTKKYPNDTDLGKAVRNLINAENKIIDLFGQLKDGWYDEHLGEIQFLGWKRREPQVEQELKELGFELDSMDDEDRGILYFYKFKNN